MFGFNTNFTGAFDSLQKQLGNPASKSDRLPQNAASQAVESLDKMSSATEILGKVVANKLGAQEFEFPQPEQNTESATGFFDIDQVVDTVAGYIEGVLGRERAAGASEERLQQIAEATRGGVEQGFGEARDIISDAGMMTEDLAQDIDTSEERIYQRIDNFFGDDSDDSEQAPPPPPELPMTSGRASSGADFNYREQFGTVELQTQDGDTISISLASVDYSSSYFNRLSENGVDLTEFGFTAMSGASFSISVDGDLDDGEVAAINDFLTQVDGLAESFFDGQLDAALNKAMSLDYDTSELASFAIDFSYTEVTASTRTYQGVQDLGSEPAPSLAKMPNVMGPIKDFSDRVADMVQRNSLIDTSSLGLLGVLDQFVNEREQADGLNASQRVRGFAEALIKNMMSEV